VVLGAVGGVLQDAAGLRLERLQGAAEPKQIHGHGSHLLAVGVRAHAGRKGAFFGHVPLEPAVALAAPAARPRAVPLLHGLARGGEAEPSDVLERQGVEDEVDDGVQVAIGGDRRRLVICRHPFFSELSAKKKEGLLDM